MIHPALGELDAYVSRTSRAALWWAIGVFATAARLFAGLLTGGLRRPGVDEYNSIARTLVDGLGFVYGHAGVLYYSYAPPLYAWILAGSYYAFHSILPIMVLQTVVGGVVAVMTAAIAERTFGNRMAGAAAGVFVAVHPGLAFYNSGKAHPLTFDAFFFTLVVLMTLRFADRPTMRRAVALGLATGLGTLSRGTTLIFLPIGLTWWLVTTPRLSRRHAIAVAIVACLCAAAVIAPWSIRNSQLHHRFVWLLTTDSEDFWRGNNPTATGHSHIDASRIVLTSIPPEELADFLSQPTELDQADWFARKARQFVRENPGTFLLLTVKKLRLFWWFGPQTGVLYPPISFWAYAAYYVLILSLAAIGVWTTRRRGASTARTVTLIVICLAALSVLQSLYYVEGRHRWAVEPLLIVLSGGGVAALAASTVRANGRLAA